MVVIQIHLESELIEKKKREKKKKEKTSIQGLESRRWRKGCEGGYYKDQRLASIKSPKTTRAIVVGGVMMA